MPRSLFVASLCSLSLVACVEVDDPTTSSGTYNLDPQGEHGQPEPPMLGVHHVKPAKGDHGPPGGGGGGPTSPNLNYHNGPIMSHVVVQPIYWGPSWSDSAYVDDKVAGLAQLYNGYAGSTYAETNTEYTDAGGTYVTSTDISVDGDLFDPAATPRRAPKTSAVLSEVCKMISNPQAGGYYPVYTDIKRGSAGYCAWHSWGSCGGVDIQFAFFFDLDGDRGCDPQDTTSGRSQGLAALANVSGHELSEAVTDPRGNGWYDSSGAENSDKCAWAFDEPVNLADGSVWKIQGNWSNEAYDAGNGFPNSSGEKGCLYNN